MSHLQLASQISKYKEVPRTRQCTDADGDDSSLSHTATCYESNPMKLELDSPEVAGRYSNVFVGDESVHLLRPVLPCRRSTWGAWQVRLGYLGPGSPLIRAARHLTCPRLPVCFCCSDTRILVRFGLRRLHKTHLYSVSSSLRLGSIWFDLPRPFSTSALSRAKAHNRLSSTRPLRHAIIF